MNFMEIMITFLQSQTEESEVRNKFTTVILNWLENQFNG